MAYLIDEFTYCIWVTEDNGDPRMPITARDLDPAKQWCEEHCRVKGSGPVIWEPQLSDTDWNGYTEGKNTVYYSIERVPLI